MKFSNHIKHKTKPKLLLLLSLLLTLSMIVPTFTTQTLQVYATIQRSPGGAKGVGVRQWRGRSESVAAGMRAALSA